MCIISFTAYLVFLIIYSLFFQKMNNMVQHNLLTSILIGLFCVSTSFCGAAIGFFEAIITFLLFSLSVLHKYSSLSTVLITELPILVKFSFMGIVIGAIVSTTKKGGSLFVWSYITQLLGDLFAHITDLVLKPEFYLLILLPYRSIEYLMYSLSSMFIFYLFLIFEELLKKRKKE